MISIKTEKIKDLCNKILPAVDTVALSEITETLQIKTIGKHLYFYVTNREYFMSVKFEMDDEIEFNATVNANLFLKLISKTTTENVELSTDSNCLIVKGNGSYKIPMIYNGNSLLELPEISIVNVTKNFKVATSVLKSMITYNSKEISKNEIVRPVQKLYYVDNNGCITFTSGACVNNFTFGGDVKLLFNDRLVKLFKLFNGENVDFTLGFDAVNSEIMQTKVRFEDDSITLTAILSCDDALLNSVPVTNIRNRANTVHTHSVNLNKNNLLEAINRLSLFKSKTDRPYNKFSFSTNSVTIVGKSTDINEVIEYDACASLSTPYDAVLDVDDLKLTLEGCSEEFVNLSFGDSQAFVITRNNVKNVIPEIIGE